MIVQQGYDPTAHLRVRSNATSKTRGKVAVERVETTDGTPREFERFYEWAASNLVGDRWTGITPDDVDRDPPSNSTRGYRRISTRSNASEPTTRAQNLNTTVTPGLPLEHISTRRTTDASTWMGQGLRSQITKPAEIQVVSRLICLAIPRGSSVWLLTELLVRLLPSVAIRNTQEVEDGQPTCCTIMPE